MSNPRPPLRCPVCRAAFRGVVVCSRCGSDLGCLMRIAARAYMLRRSALALLEQGSVEQALRQLIRAKQLTTGPN